MRPTAFATATAILMLGGCSTGLEPNPFAGLIETKAPPTAAAFVFTGQVASATSLRREVFSAERSGANPSRLTFCNTAETPCDTVEVAPGPDRNRVMVRRALADSNGDGALDLRDSAGVVFVDLARGVEAALVPASTDVTGVDWSPRGGTVLYSARSGGQEDLFVMDPNGQNARAITGSPNISERRPRIEGAERYAVFERVPAGERGHVALLAGAALVPLTPPGQAAGAALAGSAYTIGSDADPAPSPDGGSVAFRRLRGAGNGGLGAWDIMTVGLDGGNLRLVATGPSWRGAPDWGPDGIVFAEIDLAAGRRSITLVPPDGTRTETLVALPLTPSTPEAYPRWLP